MTALFLLSSDTASGDTAGWLQNTSCVLLFSSMTWSLDLMGRKKTSSFHQLPPQGGWGTEARRHRGKAEQCYLHVENISAQLANPCTPSCAGANVRSWKTRGTISTLVQPAGSQPCKMGPFQNWLDLGNEDGSGWLWGVIIFTMVIQMQWKHFSKFCAANQVKQNQISRIWFGTFSILQKLLNYGKMLQIFLAGNVCDEKSEHYSTEVYVCWDQLYLFSTLAKLQVKVSLNRVLEVGSRTEAKLDRILSTGVLSLSS